MAFRKRQIEDESGLYEYAVGALGRKMRSVAEQTSTVDSLRLAVLAALNIADEYHLLKKKYEAVASEYRQRAGLLAGALDEVLEENRRAG